MPSVAERKAARRARTAARAADVQVLRQAQAAGVVVGPAPAPKEKSPARVRRQTGLQFLAGRGKISAAQAAAGERFGRAFRLSLETAGPSLKSSLAEPERVGGGAGGGIPAPMNYDLERRIALARAELQDLRLNWLSNHSGMVAVLDVVCGRELAPGEVTTIQREQEEIVTGLRIALDLVVDFYATIDKSN